MLAEDKEDKKKKRGVKKKKSLRRKCTKVCPVDVNSNGRCGETAEDADLWTSTADGFTVGFTTEDYLDGGNTAKEKDQTAGTSQQAVSTILSVPIPRPDLSASSNRLLKRPRMAQPRELLGIPQDPWKPVPKPTENTEEGLMTAVELYNHLNDGQLSPYLFDPSYILMVDTRSLVEYKKDHIITAVHYSNLENPVLIQPLNNYTIIVVYDKNGLTYSLTDSPLSKRLEEYKQKNLEPYILEGGYDVFYEKFPFLCNSRAVYTEKCRQQLLKPYPSIIIEDQLYLGRGDQAEDEDIVLNSKITHILNITKEYKNVFENRLAYLHLSLEDEPSTDLQAKFGRTNQFLHDGILSGGRVFVHCTQGVSRSASVILAYLMLTRKWTLKDAFDFVRVRRPIISPNKGFIKQLSSYEKKLFGKKLSPSDEYELRRP